MFVRNPRAGRVTLHLFEDQRRRFVLPTREQRHCAKLFMGIDHCGDPRQLAVLFDLAIQSRRSRQASALSRGGLAIAGCLRAAASDSINVSSKVSLRR
jgi:hypothetical protein